MMLNADIQTYTNTCGPFNILINFIVFFFCFQKHQELSLPAEDSIDIFNNETTIASQGGLDLNFSSLDSTHPHESNKENDPFSKLHLDFSRIDGTQDKDELIGLCSGQFSGKWKRLFSSVMDSLE